MRDRRVLTSAAAAGSILVLTLVLPGCRRDQPSRTAAHSSAEPGSLTDQGGSPRYPPAGAGGAVPDAPTGPIKNSSIEGVQVALLQVKRMVGDTLLVRWRTTNIGQEGRRLSGGDGDSTDEHSLTAGAYLVDPVSNKKYVVLRDTENAPASSTHGHGQGVTLRSGQFLDSWAIFPGPPPEVEKISVYLPGVPPFESVPIAK
jgi:hypothetical protein